nr:hypothetical protein [uncultured Faecalimonas sp.]
MENRLFQKAGKILAGYAQKQCRWPKTIEKYDKTVDRKHYP